MLLSSQVIGSRASISTIAKPRQGHIFMKEKTNVKPFPKKKRDYLDELINKEGTDEMGLLDLIFAEEILSQKKQDKAG